MRQLVALALLTLVASPAFSQAPATGKAAPKAKVAPAKAPPGAAPALSPALSKGDAFREFCREWFAKLTEREARNTGLIEWEQGMNWVQGTYTGFAPDYTCIVDGDESTMVGKMTYREVKYEKRGATVDEAKSRAPHALETTEVTEIFRYEKGQWVY